MISEVSFTAGEREYRLAFTISAMVKYEEKFNEPFLSLVDRLAGNNIAKVHFSFLMDLFQLALNSCHGDIDDDQALEIADKIGAGKIINLISDAINSAFPGDEGDKKKAKPVQSKMGLDQK